MTTSNVPKPTQSAQGARVGNSSPFAYSSSASRLIGLFSDQKKGKSCTVVSAADYFLERDLSIHVLDVDGGFESAWNLWKDSGHPLDKLVITPVGSYRELHAGLWNPPKGHGLYVIDTYTRAMKFFKGYVQRELGLGEKGGQLELTDWRKVGGKISGLAIDYLERWSEVVASYDAWGLVICHEYLMKDDDLPTPRIVPDLVGKARAHMAGLVNFLLHLESRRVAEAGKFIEKREFRTKDDPVVMAGDRSCSLDPFEPANLSHVLRKVETKRAGGIGESVLELTKEG